MARILFVSKDRQSGRYLSNVARVFARHNTFIFAEGLSKEIWRQDGFKLAFEGPDLPNKSNVADPPFGSVNPDIVIVGTSHPPGIEALAAQYANARGIPLVVFPDTWGAAHRIDGMPNLILALDEQESRIERARYPKTKVVVVGDPMLDEIDAVIKTVPASIIERLEAERAVGCRTLLIVGQGAAYTPVMLHVAAQSVLKSPGCWRVIPRVLHPKKPDQGLADEWRKIARTLEGRVLDVDALWSTDHLAAAADATVSVFSTALRVAAGAGKTAVSVFTPKTVLGMRDSTSLTFYPPVRNGLVRAIRGPVDLGMLQPSSATSSTGRFSPERAQKAVEGLLS